jgi:hypothetical protein
MQQGRIDCVDFASPVGDFHGTPIASPALGRNNKKAAPSFRGSRPVFETLSGV